MNKKPNPGSASTSIFSSIRMTLAVMPGNTRQKYMVLVSFVMLGALIEMIGLGLLFPVLALIANPEVVYANSYVSAIIGGLGQPDPTIVIVMALLAFVVGNVLRVCYGVFVLWKQTTFSEHFVTWLSSQMFGGYINEPYTYHLEHNSAVMLRNVTTEVNLVSAAIKNTIDIFGEVSVLIAIGALLIIVDPVSLFIVAGLLWLSVIIFHRLTSNRISYWGRQREHNENLRYRHVQEALGGIKEIKILHLENFKANAYEPFSAMTAKANQRNTFMQAIPRLWLELLFVIGIGSFLALNILQGKPMDVVVPVLGLFGAATFRLMPSINRILGALQGIRFGTVAIENLSVELERFRRCIPRHPFSSSPPPEMNFSNDITVSKMSYSYPTGHAPALDNINIHIDKGQSVGFVGGSGAGKSTLIDVLLGILTPCKGEVFVDGQRIKHNLHGWQHLLGYVPQSIYLTDGTLRSNIAYGVPDSQIDENAVKHAVKLAQLEKFVDGHPFGLDLTVGERGMRISGGQRQRIGIARALYRNPPILLLDEATSALDTETEQSLMEAIHALHGEKTLLIVAHRLTTVMNCDRIYRLANGKVIECGSASEILGDILT